MWIGPYIGGRTARHFAAMSAYWTVEAFTIDNEEVLLTRRRHEKPVFDRARDELFSHIHRCDVIGASEDAQIEWMDDTLQFMAERYPDLSKKELDELRTLGLRFCQPVIPHGEQSSDDSQGEANAA